MKSSSLWRWDWRPRIISITSQDKPEHWFEIYESLNTIYLEKYHWNHLQHTYKWHEIRSYYQIWIESMRPIAENVSFKEAILSIRKNMPHALEEGIPTPYSICTLITKRVQSPSLSKRNESRQRKISTKVKPPLEEKCH